MSRLTAKQRETELAQHASSLAYELGFTEGFTLADLGGELRWCFARRIGDRFPLEALCFVYQRRPERLLFIEWLVSDHDVNYLIQNGISGNVVLDSLFHFQIFRNNKSPSEVLPQALEVRDDTNVPALFSSLRFELLDASPQMSDRLWAHARGGA